MARETVDAAPPRRLKKREVERLRKQQRQRILMVAAVALVAATVATAVILTPPPAGAHPTKPGEIVSQTPMHIHPRLHVLVDGTERQIPGNIGLKGGVWASHDLDHFLDLREGAQGSLSPLHTHDTSGTIHVEASLTRGFTLGEFFAVWGQPLGPDQTWTFRADGGHSLTLRVNDGATNNLVTGDWNNIVLSDPQDITIAYTTLA